MKENLEQRAKEVLMERMELKDKKEMLEAPPDVKVLKVKKAIVEILVIVTLPKETSDLWVLRDLPVLPGCLATMERVKEGRKETRGNLDLKEKRVNVGL